MHYDIDILQGMHEQLCETLSQFKFMTGQERLANCNCWHYLHLDRAEELFNKQLWAELSLVEELHNKFIKRRKKDIRWGIFMIVTSLTMWLCFCFFIQPPNYILWALLYLIFTCTCIRNGLHLITDVSEREATVRDVIETALVKIDEYIEFTQDVEWQT